jgi:hypothetical protein
MTEIIQRLRTEFVFDTMSAEASLARLRGEYEKLEAAAKRYSAIPPRLEADIALARTTGAEMGGGGRAVSMSSEARQIAQIEADLRTPMDLGPVDFGFANERARAGIDFMDGVAGSISDELTLMDEAFSAVQKADREAEKQAKKTAEAAGKSKGVWGDFSSNLKQGAKDTFQPLTDMGSAVLEVGKGLGVIGSVAYAAVAAIDAISDAFSRSGDIARQYAEAVDGLDDELRSLKRESDDFWADLGPKLPNQDEIDKWREKVRDIRGTDDSDMAPGEPGKFQKANEKWTNIDTFIRDVQDTIRDTGAEIGANGEILYNSPRARSNRPNVEGILKETAYSEGDEYIGGYDAALRRREQLEVAMADLAAQRAEAETRATEQYVKGLDKVAGFASSLTSSINLLDPSAFVGLVKSNQKKEKDAKDAAHFLKHGKFPIDARGARITVNTRIDTDDPARFADVAIKSAFLGAAARPLSATMGLGAPMVGGARNP